MPGLVVICAAWIVIPTAVLVIYSVLSEPMYYPRYLIPHHTPAMAVLMAICIATIARKTWPIAGVVLLFVVAGLPITCSFKRWPYAKRAGDYSQVADVIRAHAAPGDCLLVDNTVPWKPGPIRALVAARPEAYRSLTDVERGVYGPRAGSLWDGHVAVWLSTARSTNARRCGPSTDPRQIVARLPERTIVAAGPIRARAGVSISQLPGVPPRRALAISLRTGRQVDAMTCGWQLRLRRRRPYCRGGPGRGRGGWGQRLSRTADKTLRRRSPPAPRRRRTNQRSSARSPPSAVLTTTPANPAPKAAAISWTMLIAAAAAPLSSGLSTESMARMDRCGQAIPMPTPATTIPLPTERRSRRRVGALGDCGQSQARCHQ